MNFKDVLFINYDVMLLNQKLRVGGFAARDLVFYAALFKVDADAHKC